MRPSAAIAMGRQRRIAKRRKGTPRARAMMETVMTRESDPTWFQGLGFLPNPDEVLRARGIDQTVYEKLLTDDHLFAQYQVRKADILNCELRLTEASAKRQDVRAKELCEAVILKSDNLRHLVSTLLDAPFYGHRAAEVLWGRDGSHIVPLKFEDVPNRRLVFGDQAELRLLTRASRLVGEEIPPFKFLLAQHMASHDNPHGQAALSRCFWPVTFKRAGLDFWVTMLERYGMPHVYGRVPPGTSQPERSKLLKQLSQMVQDAVAVINNDQSIEFKEAEKTASSDAYSRFHAAMNASISKVVLGQTLTTEASAKGTQALGTVHNDVRASLMASDKSLVEAVLTTLCRWVTALNIPGASAPTAGFYEEDQVPAEWAKFFDQARKYVPIPLGYALRRLGIPEAEGDEPTLPGEPQSAPALVPPVAPEPEPEPEPDEPSDPDADFAATLAGQTDWLGTLTDRSLRAYASEVWPAIVADIRDAVSAGGTLGALGDPDELPERLQTAGFDLLEDLIGRTMFMAALKALLDVEEETGDADFADPVGSPLPWDDAAEEFATRLPLTSAQLDQLQSTVRARAFTVAAVQHAEVLTGIQTAIQSALSDGSNLQTYLKDLDTLAARTGWDGLGKHGATVVFRNNVMSVYGTARFKALRDPAVMARRPYWEYVPVSDDRTRDEHALLTGTVLRADDPAWASIFPPNGHQCRCGTRTVSEREFTRRGLELGSGETLVAAPAPGWNRPPGSVYQPDLTKFPESVQRALAARAVARFESISTPLSRADWLTARGLDPSTIDALLEAAP